MSQNSHGANDPDDPEYRVGPGRPPKQHQFKPGQSGNPKGRKAKSRSGMPDMKKMLQEALNEKVKTREGQRERRASKLKVGLRQLATQVAKGDARAFRTVLELAERFGVNLLQGDDSSVAAQEGQALAANEQAILADFLRRHASETNLRDGAGKAPAQSGPEAPSGEDKTENS